MIAAPSGALWPSRYLTDGRLLITRAAPARAPKENRPTVLHRFGRQWRRMRRWQQWVAAFLIGSFAAAPLNPVSEDLQGAVALIIMALIGVLVVASRESPESPAPTPTPPELSLAAADTTEARVAAAASRAWVETTREPSWQSPYLAQSRAAFDGGAEVDQIIGLALRIQTARRELGLRPTGPAAEYWDRQHQALENAAHQLGDRADALIRYRDQAALLSVELRHLADLDRMERTAAEIDGLTVETAYASGRGDGGIGTVADEIAGVRQAMTELLDLMTRTRAPLLEPPDATSSPR